MKSKLLVVTFMCVGMFHARSAAAKTVCYPWIATGTFGCCSGIVCTDGSGSGTCSACYTATNHGLRPHAQDGSNVQLAGAETMTINNRIVHLRWSSITDRRKVDPRVATIRTEAGGM